MDWICGELLMGEGRGGEGREGREGREGGSHHGAEGDLEITLLLLEKGADVAASDKVPAQAARTLA